jgi:hypothetical protein
MACKIFVLRQGFLNIEEFLSILHCSGFGWKVFAVTCTIDAHSYTIGIPIEVDVVTCPGVIALWSALGSCCFLVIHIQFVYE